MKKKTRKERVLKLRRREKGEVLKRRARLGGVSMRGDWASRLFEFIDGRRETKFRYGRHDCVMFAGDCVKAMTGLDMVEDWRGEYRGKRKADQLIAAGPSATLESLVVSKMLQFRVPEVGVRYISRGDLIYGRDPLDDSEFLAIGVGNGKMARAAKDKGVVFSKFSGVVRAWKFS